jgi:uncharacterized protein YjbI with pentapeptide repeats
LERLLFPLVHTKARGLVVVTAGAGGGKTVALRHLRAVLPSDLVGFYDSHEVASAVRASRTQLVIHAGEEARDLDVLATFELCPWTLDDCLEYLVAVRRPQCASVLSRLKDDAALALLRGTPQLLTAVMNAMAEDSSIATARQALGKQIMRVLPMQDRDRYVIDSSTPLNAEQRRWLRHDIVRQMCVAGWIGDELSRGATPALLNGMKQEELIPEIAEALRDRPQAVDCLENLVKTQPQASAVPMGASILLRLNPNWRPAIGRVIQLTWAQLANARWSGVDLSSALLSGANLSKADLSGAKLACAVADGADFSGANLHGAVLDHMVLTQAKLTSADLSDVSALHANFSQADLDGARLNHASLDDAKFNRSNMENAECRWAKFFRAQLVDTSLRGANFQSGYFRRARIYRVDMSEANWAGASFAEAQLRQCNLEGLELPYADFERANLNGSLLTGSLIRGGNFRGASFRQAGLAEVEWEDADLRDADFTNASFHLGSTRSGLVGSTIPGEGSRTGFYTDDFNEQDFKAPEEIRKACLCGANLLRPFIPNRKASTF